MQAICQVLDFHTNQHKKFQIVTSWIFLSGLLSRRQEERVRNGQAFPPGCPVALQLAGFDVWRYSLAERKV